VVFRFYEGYYYEPCWSGEDESGTARLNLGRYVVVVRTTSSSLLSPLSSLLSPLSSLLSPLSSLLSPLASRLSSL
jgi:hypothetical protein